MFKKAFGNDGRKLAYFAYVDCRNTELPIADFLVTIEGSRDDLHHLKPFNLKTYLQIY